MSNLQGFKVIRVKFDSASTAPHEMFVKEHSVRNQTEDTPSGLTLFAINVPPWATETALSAAFSTAAPVTSVKFTKLNQDSASGFKMAFVVFKTAAGLYKALRLNELPPLSTPEHPILTGMQKWMHEYNEKVLSQPAAYAEAVEIVNRYDAEEERKKQKEKAGETDDEGWTVVTKKGRNPGMSRKESVVARLAEKRTRKEKVLKNFYRHQVRQEKRDQLATLRKRAEEDKKKILALKQRRAFRPF